MLLIYPWISTTIAIAVILLIAGVVMYFLVKQGNKGREEINKLRAKGVRYTEVHRPWEGGFGLGGLLLNAILDATAKDGTYYTCKFCGFMSTENSDFCPECGKNDLGEVRQYKCKYCLYTSTENSKYCPKCHKDDKGSYGKLIS